MMPARAVLIRSAMYGCGHAGAVSLRGHSGRAGTVAASARPRARGAQAPQARATRVMRSAGQFASRPQRLRQIAGLQDLNDISARLHPDPLRFDGRFSTAVKRRGSPEHAAAACRAPNRVGRTRGHQWADILTAHGHVTGHPRAVTRGRRPERSFTPAGPAHGAQHPTPNHLWGRGGNTWKGSAVSLLRVLIGHK